MCQIRVNLHGGNARSCHQFVCYGFKLKAAHCHKFVVLLFDVSLMDRIWDRQCFVSIMIRAICRLLFVQARCFYEQRSDVRARTRCHIGTHPIIMEGVSQHTQFAAMLKDCARQLRHWASHRDGNKFVATIFCRAGEKRSVAFATFLAIAMLNCGVFAGSGCQIFHLSDWYWRRHTCQGICHECRNAMDPAGWQRTDIAGAVRIFCSP